MKKILSAAAAIIVALSLCACGQNNVKKDSPIDFAIINKLGCSLSEVYVSASTTEDWGNNLLGTTPFEANKQLDVKFTGDTPDTTVFDIAVFTTAGTEYQFKSIDLSTSTLVTLTMQNGAPVAAIQ